MLGSGNREDINTEETDEQAQVQQVPTTPKTEIRETIPFKKPVIPLPEHLKVTSIKDILEKDKPIIFENTVENEEPIAIEKETLAIPEVEIQPVEQEPVFILLQDCWIDCIKESSTQNTIIAVEFLSKQIPTDNENHIIEIEIPNEMAKQEIKEIIPALTDCIAQKTGIFYSFDFKIIQPVQKKQIDRTNPDENFLHIVQENPKLMDFKQRLNLSVS